MTLTYIWTGFFLVGFVAALVQWLVFGDVTVFKRIIDGTFDSAKVGVMDIALPLAGYGIGLLFTGADGEAYRPQTGTDGQVAQLQRAVRPARNGRQNQRDNLREPTRDRAI